MCACSKLNSKFDRKCPPTEGEKYFSNIPSLFFQCPFDREHLTHPYLGKRTSSSTKTLSLLLQSPASAFCLSVLRPQSVLRGPRSAQTDRQTEAAAQWLPSSEESVVCRIEELQARIIYFARREGKSQGTRWIWAALESCKCRAFTAHAARWRYEGRYRFSFL